MDYFWPLLPLLFPSVFQFLFTCTPFSRMQHEIGTSFPILIYSLPLPLASPGFPPPLCVIHNRTSAGLHVSHMGGTPVFFNTFLIPPFEAPLVHYNLYWLLNKIKGLVLAASRLCCTLLQKNAFFITHTHTYNHTHLGMFILTWKWDSERALAVTSHSSLVVVISLCSLRVCVWLNVVFLFLI